MINNYNWCAALCRKVSNNKYGRLDVKIKVADKTFTYLWHIKSFGHLGKENVVFMGWRMNSMLLLGHVISRFSNVIECCFLQDRMKSRGLQSQFGMKLHEKDHGLQMNKVALRAWRKWRFQKLTLRTQVKIGQRLLSISHVVFFRFSDFLAL